MFNGKDHDCPRELDNEIIPSNIVTDLEVQIKPGQQEAICHH